MSEKWTTTSVPLFKVLAACPSPAPHAIPPHRARRAPSLWRDVVRDDLIHQRPFWVLSCYGHAREGANDLTGDVSPEEVGSAVAGWGEGSAGLHGVVDAAMGTDVHAIPGHWECF